MPARLINSSGFNIFNKNIESQSQSLCKMGNVEIIKDRDYFGTFKNASYQSQSLSQIIRYPVQINQL